MSGKTAMTLAAGIIVGSAWSAYSYQLDPNTGLPTEYYYGPVSEHAKQGLPVNGDTVKKYAPAQQGASSKATASAKRRSTINLLESRPIIVPVGSDDKHSGHLW